MSGVQACVTALLGLGAPFRVLIREVSAPAPSAGQEVVNKDTEMLTACPVFLC